MKRICMFLLCIILAAGAGTGVSARGIYDGIDVEIPVGGTGTFYLKEEGKPDTAAFASASIRGKGSLTVTLDEPGSYRYELFSKEDVNSMRYDVYVEVTADDGNVLEALAAVAEKGRDRKLPVAYYPPEAVNPRVSKYVTGDTPETEETFSFVFRAVSTTAAGQGGEIPMPEGAEGRTLRLEIRGGGTVEAGEIVFPASGEYLYEVTEEAGSAGGYSYDKSVFRILYRVTEGPECLETEEILYKDGEKIEEGTVSFVNRYTKSGPGTNPKPGPGPGAGIRPRTGDENQLALWIGLTGISFAAAVLLILGAAGRKRRDTENG